MCRHLARIGPPLTLRALLYDPPHSLLEQSYAPRLQRHGRVNADGFGVGWYADGRERPARYRRAQPMWTDRSFESVAAVVRARLVLAAVRSATIGFPVEESCTAPLTCGRLLFSHNGAVGGLAHVEEKVRELAGGAAAEPDARAPVDSALLFAIVLARVRDGHPLPDALASVVEEVGRLTPARLNLLATDGVTLAGTTYGETLFTRETGEEVVLASEPYDDAPGWREVPSDALVTADADGVHVTPLPVTTPVRS